MLLFGVKGSMEANQDKRQKYDWVLIQAYYDEGNTMLDCARKFGACKAAFAKAKARGDFKSRTIAETSQLVAKRDSGKPRKPVSEDAKLAIRAAIAKKVAEGTWHYSFSKVRTHKFVSKFNGEVSLMGSWELKYAQYLDANDIEWRRVKEKFPYEFAGLKSGKGFYTPDFFLIKEGVYVEVKGYETDKDRAKWSCFPANLTLRVLKREDLEALGIENLSKKNNNVGQPEPSPTKSKTIEVGEANPRKPRANQVIRPERFCSCGTSLKGYQKAHCSQKCRRAVSWPAKEDLEKLIASNTLLDVARQFGVTDNAVRKWCKYYGIDNRALSPMSRVNRVAPPKKGFIPLSKYMYVKFRPNRNHWIASRIDPITKQTIFYKTCPTEESAAQFVAEFMGSKELIVRQNA